MHDVNRGRGRAWAMAIALAALVLAACGTATTSTGDAGKLLSQTFSGAHKVSSGNVSFALSVQSSGSSTLKAPISFSLGGPFQSRGAGKLPLLNFTISLSANGKGGSVAVLSTGTRGYVTVQGKSYQLPPATFQKLESSFAQAAARSGTGSGSGTLNRLGIQPLGWLRNSSIVGSDTLGGASTTHIRAGVNVTALVNDLSTLLQRASSLGVSGAAPLSGGLPAATRSQIVSAIRNPSVDVWTGTADKTLRKLQVAAEVGSATIGLTLQFANLNEPQTITAPAALRPFSELAGKLRGFLQTFPGAAALSGSSSSAGTATGASAANVQRYSRCVQAAGNNAGKLQQCASLLAAK